MKCTNCGNEVNQNERLCFICGENNPNYVEPLVAQVNQQPNPHVTPSFTTITQTNPMNTTKDTLTNEKQANVGFTLSFISLILMIIGIIFSISVIGSINAYSGAAEIESAVGALAMAGTLFIVSVILGVLGIIFSAVSKKVKHKNNAKATAGLVIGIVVVGFYVISLLF